MSISSKKIWILNHYAQTPYTSGGTRHFDLASGLIKKGYDVTIFASSFHYAKLKELKEYKDRSYIEENVDGVKFVWIKTFQYTGNTWRRIVNMLSYTVRVIKIGKQKNFQKPDMIIGSSVHLFAVYSAYRLARYYRVPFVMEVRDLWPKTLIDMGYSNMHPFIMLLGCMEKFLYKKAIKIITLLPRLGEYITSMGISKEKMVWIPNGLDLNKFLSLKEKVKSDNNNSIFQIAYTGNFGKLNRLDIVIEAAAIVNKSDKQIQFLLVGDGPQKDNLKGLVKNKSIENVVFGETVPKDKVVDILMHADALVFNTEDFPALKFGISSNKLFDYMASGKPILFSCNAGNNPVEESGCGITVPPALPEKLAEAVIRLKNLPQEERKQMGERGLKYIKENHSMEILVEKLEITIKEVTEPVH